MIFSSILFLTIFFPLFLLVYFILPRKLPVKHLFILTSSFIFYAWGEPKFVFVIFFTTIIDFYLVKLMDRFDDPSKRKLFLFFPILLNLGLLCYFKYYNFFLDNLNSVAGSFNLPLVNFTKLILPIGISFFTFESITYSVDVYRRVHKPLNKFWDYQMYIIFFPKLIAGPIVRYHEIADQIQNHIHQENFRNRLNGFIRFSVGLCKKVFIANVVGRQADAIFALDPQHLTTSIAWIGAIAFMIELYFDFSGYSDIALGISLMLGFKLPENFNNPFISKSVTEFWKRWHITLGNFMKNYLYIPLGGNRVTQTRWFINLFIVFVLSGIWHGAGWNFVLWGFYYGLFLTLERLFFRQPTGYLSHVGLLYTFIVVVIGGVIFRIGDLQVAFKFIYAMFSFNFSPDYFFVFQADFFFFFLIGLFFSFCTLNNKIRIYSEKFFAGAFTKKELSIYSCLSVVAYTLCLISLSGGSFSPFIYFKF